ncbi:hypothetical protein J2Z75_001526 [Rhizobium herbae]|uniref:Uncharacterized protein n=1 Tax=Rhizobium herbae TaxID=508661 RepID=A0ABS4EJA5_9HYPH|nr:hypothetical protein [Rhizobium herbae]
MNIEDAGHFYMQYASKMIEMGKFGSISCI